MDVEYKIYAYITGGCVDATSINNFCIAVSRVKVNAHTRIPDNPLVLHLWIFSSSVPPMSAQETGSREQWATNCEARDIYLS